jgi:hypothetical protein
MAFYFYISKLQIDYYYNKVFEFSSPSEANFTIHVSNIPVPEARGQAIPLVRFDVVIPMSNVPQLPCRMNVLSGYLG